MPLLLLLLFSILFCFYTKTRCIQRLERNKLKKPLNPYKVSKGANLAPSSGPLVHSKDPDQRQQSEDSDHGLH